MGGVVPPTSPMRNRIDTFGDRPDSPYMTPPPQDLSSDQVLVDEVFSLPGIHPLPAHRSMYKHHVLSVSEFTKEKVRVTFYFFIVIY